MGAEASTRQLLLQVDASVELARRNLDLLADDVRKNAASMDANLGRIDKAAERVGKSFGLVKGAVVGFVTGVVTSEITSAAMAGLEYASSLGEVAQQLGVTTRDLQVYRYAASQAGISQDEMDAGLSKLSRTIGEAADGSKKQVAAFREIGVSVTDANGKLLTAGEVIPRIADGLAKIEDPATRARIEVDLFGKAGQKLDTLLAGGSGAINDLATQADKLGLVLSDRLIQQADDAADKLAAVKQVLEAKVAGAVAENAGAIMQMGDSLLYAADAALKATKAVADYLNTAGGRNLKRDVTTFNPFTGGLLGSFIRGDGIFEPEERKLPKGGRGGGRAPAGSTFRAAPVAPSVGDLPVERPSGARRSTGGRTKASGPSLSEQFSRLEGSLDGEVSAGTDYRDALKLIDAAEKAGIKATASFADLRRAAGKNLLKDLGIEEMPIRVLETSQNLDELATKITDLPEVFPPEEVQRLREFQESFNRDLSAGLADAIVYGDDLGDVLANSFKRAAAAMIESGILELLNPGSDGGGLFRGALSLGASIFGGGRAGGGAVNPFQSFLVGEHGTELFRPSVPGVIVPNHAMMQAASSTGGGSTIQNYDLRGALVDKDVYADMHRISAGYAQRAHIGAVQESQSQIVRRSARKLGR